MQYLQKEQKLYFAKKVPNITLSLRYNYRKNYKDYINLGFKMPLPVRGREEINIAKAQSDLRSLNYAIKKFINILKKEKKIAKLEVKLAKESIKVTNSIINELKNQKNLILEQLSQISPTLPKASRVTIGPDATGVGWAYEYALVYKTKDLAELRSYQDFYLKYALLGVDDVSEIATVAGFVQNYEVTLNQDAMVSYNISFADGAKALAKNNNDTGGGVVLKNGYEKIIEPKGYLRDKKDIENIVLKVVDGLPIKIKDIMAKA